MATNSKGHGVFMVCSCNLVWSNLFSFKATEIKKNTFLCLLKDSLICKGNVLKHYLWLSVCISYSKNE